MSGRGRLKPIFVIEDDDDDDEGENNSEPLGARDEEEETSPSSRRADEDQTNWRPLPHPTGWPPLARWLSLFLCPCCCK